MLLLGVIALIVWGLMSPDEIEEVLSRLPSAVTARRQDILEDYDDDIY